MSLLPSSPDIVPDTSPRVVGVDSEDADALMSALSSGTARRLLAELHEEPAPPSALADRIDTSLQNAQYHLANLEEAGAVEVVGTAYSEKGREMDVYAPADRPLVIFAGNEEQTSGLRAALKRLVGGIAALGVGALVVQELFGRSVVNRLAGLGSQPASETGGGAGGGDAGGEDDAGGVAGDGDGGGDGADGGGADGDADGGGLEADEATETPTPEEEVADQSTTETVNATGGDGDAAGTATETATPEPEAAEAATETATETAAETAHEAATPTPTSTPTEAVTEAGDAAFDGGVAAISTLPPGLLFFLGGLTVLLAAVLLAYR